MSHVGFFNMTCPLVGLGLVDVIEHDFEASEISETILNNFDELAVVLPLAVFVDDDMGVHDAKSGSNLV